MARHGENIRLRRDGRWEGRYGIYNGEKKKKVYVSVYGKSYGEVKEKLTTKKILLKNKAEAPGTESEKPVGPDISFGSAAAEWLEAVKRTKKLSTYVKYTQVYENHIKELFQDVPLSGMTDTAVGEKLRRAGERADTLSDSLLKSIYCILNQILKSSSGGVLPCLKKPETKSVKRPVRTFSMKEQKKLFFMLRCDMDRFKLAVLLCLHMGLRLGELCALKWTDIDLKNRTLTVSRTVQRLPVEGYGKKTILWEGEPKSGYSRREIPLTGEMAKLLMQSGNGRVYVFGGDKPVEPRTMQNHFKKILEEAGVQEKNFHTLRHTFATNCVEGGMDVKSLSEMLGHSDVRITLNRYVHPSMDVKRKYMDSLCLFYGQIYGQAC